MNEPRVYLDRLYALVREEQEATLRRIAGLWQQPVASRVARGRAIAGVRVERLAPGGYLDLTCTRNESRFREGDMVCLNRGDPAASPSLMGSLEADDGRRVTIGVRERFDPSTLREAPDGWVLDEGYLDLGRYLLGALDQLAGTRAGRERILPLIADLRRPAIDGEAYERALAWAAGQGLDASQAEALALAGATDLAYLVTGPPGTGKTLMLATLARRLAESGERVLITALTHRAINNALDKVAQVAPGLPAVKVGPPARALGLSVPNLPGFAASELAASEGGYVVGATPYACRTSRLAAVEFDTVIADEASQITLPLAIMAMLSGRRWIFTGDPRQLPPVLLTRGPSEALKQSVFGLFGGRGFEATLDTSYRLGEALIRWPNRHFYGGRLRSAAGARAPAVTVDAQGTLGELLAPDPRPVFLALNRWGDTTRNRAEARWVTAVCEALAGAGCPAGEIGIVTPYRMQGRLIRASLRQALPAEAPAIVADTVERMQGQERDVVILSLTTSDPAFAGQMAGFLFQPERLNVSVTRARSRLIVMGSGHLVELTPDRPEDEAGVALFRDLAASCRRVEAGD